MKTLGVVRLGTVALLWCMHITSATATTFTHDAFISFADLSNEGQDIVVTNCTLTVDGPHAFNSLHVLNGGVLTHSALPYGPQQFTFSVAGESHALSAINPVTLNNTNVDTSTLSVMNSSGTIFYTEGVDYIVTVANPFIQLMLTTNSAIAEGATVLVDYDWSEDFQGFLLTINHDAQIATGGAINVSGKGYAGGIGANNGVGTSHATNFPFAFTAGGGGGHGGAGGMGSTSARGGATYDSTTNPAAMGSGGGIGSADGGAGGGVATLFVGGNLQMDGQILAGGFRGTNAHSGGGSGGSILISGASISGAGLISANGGNGDTPDGGGGGGGRIAIYFGLNFFSGNISAFGGGGSMAGGAGTVYLQSNTSRAGQLFIVNGGKRGTNTTFSAPVSDLTISGGAILQPPILPLSITNLFLGSNSVLMSLDSLPLTITVNGNATIETDAIINADFKSLTGQGMGTAGCGAGSGGSYGGYGGASACGAPSGEVYGLMSQPLNLGSPGPSGIRAGGAIKMTVAGTLSLAGSISANGASAVAAASGSGSGGSVWLTVGTFSGAGTVSANGGSSSNFVSGGGGGGRVAVYFTTSLFTGSIAAHGGSGTNSGGPGSVYLKASVIIQDSLGPIPQIIFDNAGLVGTTYAQTILPMSDLTISGGTLFTNNQSAAPFLRSLFIGSNSFFIPFRGLATGGNLTVTNVTIQSGGGIIADGAIVGTGLGAGQSSALGGGGGGGGGIGGAGASNAPGGTATLGSITFPTMGGGAGGSGNSIGVNPGGFGGGFISLTVPGTLILNGRISANGLSSSSFNSGGGGGGSLQLSAGTLTGSGSISANGGAGNNAGGGGGGGAIALTMTTNLFSGAITAMGGSGANYGGAGTIYLSPLIPGKPSIQVPQLILDNGGNRGARTPVTIFPEASDVTITGGALVSNAVTIANQLRSLVVGSNSVLQVAATAYSTINVSSNLTVLAGGSFNADGMSSSGNGVGESLNSTGGGGGNAGAGGASALGARGGNPFVDSISSPISFGGRGGFGVNQFAGGNGGGALRISVGGTLRVDGRLSADGVTSTNLNSGGGAGGAVSLSTKLLSGNGIISASGGAGNGLGGGGGGGHIAVSYTTNGFTGTVAARGGSGANYGGAGIIYLNGGSGFGPISTQVILDNGGIQGGLTFFFTPPQGNFNLTVTGGAILTNALLTTVQNLVIGSNSTWLASTLTPFNLLVLSNAVIQPGGSITDDGVSSIGPSPGQTLAGTGGGGGHGGSGGASISNAPGGNATSDSIGSPTGLGSAGGSSGGLGGGTLQINVRGTLQLDGKLSVNGTTSPTSINSGGGSGGSISITATKFTGSGIISANGGAASNLGGGGGGGRIGVGYSTNSFTGTLMARGGAGANFGGAGTIYLTSNPGPASPIASLILDNGGAHGTATPLLSSLSSIGQPSVIITNGAVMSLGLTTTPTLNNLSISSNSSLTLASNITSMHLQINGNFDLQAGGSLNLDGQGFPANSGIGLGTAGIGHGTGGGHGGYGSVGNSGNSPSGIPYDSLSNPAVAGSGGGSSNSNTGGSWGGGAAQLTVNGICTVNGIITANGAPGITSGAGGGSGGAILLTAGTISGSGKIRADGGNGDIFTSGGGGGGRIAVYFNTNHFTGSLSAHGGAGAVLAGGAGTIYWKTNFPTINLPGDVIVDNGGFAGTNTPITTLNPPASLLIRNGGRTIPSQSPTFRSLSIGANSSLVDSSGTLNFTVLGDALVDTNGSILVDNDGNNSAFVGPGTGQVDFDGEGGGGGYGGAGGASYFGAAGGSTYGSSNQPVDLGSPGGMNPVVVGFSSGAGAIRMAVNGSLTVNGRVSANGADGFIDGSGGGAGGSIWVTAQKLFGNGSLTANGGLGESFEGGGGGGGRIAIYTASNLFAGNISAAGGGGASPGQDGTIYTPTSLLISGSVTDSNGAAVAGITLQPTGLSSVISDTNGYYSLNVPLFWGGSVVPSGNGTIIPSIRTFFNLSLDALNQNFLITSPTAFNFSGGQFDGTNVNLNWYGMSGVKYQVFSSTNLVDWSPYGAPFTGGNAPITLSMPPTNAPNMYFRLSVTY